MAEKEYDLILFGVTGFTGKLVSEYLLTNYGEESGDDSIKWAACARNQEKATKILNTTGVKVFEADLVCETDEQKAKLRSVVARTKVVLTCAGPFEKYGKTLVELCAELGVDYADITGAFACVCLCGPASKIWRTWCVRSN